MATLRIPESIWKQTHAHLFNSTGEHFAFFLARWTDSNGEPIFMVRDAILVPDSEVTGESAALQLSHAGVLRAINAAVKSSDCLVEVHNHGGKMPRFSTIDRRNLPEFVAYVLSSLPGRPYAATVWGDSSIYGEYFFSSDRHGTLNSITIVGQQLRQLVSRDDDHQSIEATYSRQLPWFTEEGQRQIGRLRVAIVGCGGTGSHVIQNLVYLGCRNFLLIDDDQVDDTNMNRLVTATLADVGTPKVILGRRLVKSVAPAAKVFALSERLQTAEALSALKGADVLFGCVDNDGARLILNELALAYSLPYFDVAVGIEANHGQVSLAGGRVAVVLPNGPCLNCMNQIDPEEARFFLLPPAEQKDNLARGYISGVDVPAPAVVSLNAQLVAAAINEFAILLSGLRPVSAYLEYDLLGTGREAKSQWMTPTLFKKVPSCIQCTVAGRGDAAGIERYVQPDK